MKFLEVAARIAHFEENRAACVGGDVNRDDSVDLTDLALLLIRFGSPCE